MNLAAVSSLPLSALSGRWYRAVRPQHLPAALSTDHTLGIRSRFSPGPSAARPFRTLYLAESPLVALLEVQALFGSPVRPGGLTLNKAGRWALVSADVHLSAVADLTSTAEQETMRTSAQELTGDWLGYHQRGPRHSVQQPIGIAPTQQLGEALYNDARLPEGIRAISSKVPYNMTLVVFPENLRGDSRIEFEFEQDSMEHSVRTGQGAY